jgi:hypothetical protein
MGHDMSIPLPNVDLSSAVVGSKGFIDLKNVGAGAGGVSANPSMQNSPPTLVMFNDSGCTLTITYAQTGNGFKMPAGAWIPAPLPPGENQINWSVDFVLQNAPISLLLCTYYAPGENIPTSFTLGNSPIGGAVQATGGGVVTADHLINTTNAPSSAAIIQIQETGSTGTQVFADNQGNFTVAQYVAGVLSPLIRTLAGITNGIANSNVFLGDTNHQVEVLGHLLSDLTSLFVGQVTGQAGQAGSGASAFYAQGMGNGGYGYVASSNAGDTNQVGFYTNGSTGGGLNAFQASGLWGTGFDATNMNNPSIGFKAGANNNPGIDLSHIVSGSQAIKLPVGGLTRLQWLTDINVAVAGTMVNHSLGVVPDFVLPALDGGSASTNIITIHETTMTSTQFQAYATPAYAFCCFLVGKF